uniref:Uncharacterized protein n=1 Tax=Rhizophora mucronata TaxID=61149 RepID=A0A2P2NVA5_RHIMU
MSKPIEMSTEKFMQWILKQFLFLGKMKRI